MRAKFVALAAVLVFVSVLPVTAFGAHAQPFGDLQRASSPRTTGFGGVYYINTSDPEIGTNVGVAMEATPFTMPAYTGNGSASFQLGTGELFPTPGDDYTLLAAGFEADWALSGSAVSPFAAILNETSQNITSFITEPSMPAGSILNAAVEYTHNGTWEAYLNGEPVLSLDSGVSSVNTTTNSATLLNFSSGSSAWLPSHVFLPEALMVDTGSSWVVPTDVYTGFLGNVAAPMNVSAESLNRSLFPGEFQAGSDVYSPSKGTPTLELWKAAPSTQVSLSGLVSPSPVVGGKNVTVSWQVTHSLTPVSDVYLSIFNSLGGAITHAVTSQSGWANVTIPTSEVKTAMSFYLNATVLNGTYLGEANVTVAVSPPGPTLLHVTLDATPVASQSGRFSLEILVAQGAAPAPGVEFLPAANIGGGVFSPLGPWVTNSVGIVYANYTAPPGVPRVTIWANASQSGYSGSGYAVLMINVTSTTSGSGSQINYGDLAIAIGGGIAAGVIFIGLVWLYRRPRSKAVQSLDSLESGGLVSGDKGKEEADSPEDDEEFGEI